MSRRSYRVDLTVNGRRIDEITIDSHYEIKHPDMGDKLILEIAAALNGKEFQPSGREGKWEFYVLDRIEHLGKRYRLVWCMRDHGFFIGVINCFRR